jgi:hypothetical protein
MRARSEEEGRNITSTIHWYGKSEAAGRLICMLLPDGLH